MKNSNILVRPEILVNDILRRVALGTRMRFADKKYRHMFGKLEKLTERPLGKLHPLKLVNSILYLVF